MLCRCMQGVCVSTTLKESTVISVGLGSTTCHGPLEQTRKPMLAKVCSWGEVIEWLCCLAQTKHVNYEIPCSQSVCVCIGGWLETLLHREEKAMQNDTCWDGTVAVRASNHNNEHSDIPKLSKHSGVMFSTSSWVIIRASNRDIKISCWLPPSTKCCDYHNKGQLAGYAMSSHS